MKKKTVIACLCLVLVSVILLQLANLLLQPKYMTASREGALIGEYYNEQNPSHDVLFVGDCEVYESFTPPTLWEEYGITSYIRGSAQQLTWQSYHLLEETLRYETPKVVVFNVLALKYGKPQNEAYNRMTLDGMKLSSVKLQAVRASMTEDESFASYLFPLLRFHSRWNDLGAEDFEYLFTRDRVSHNGYMMQTSVVPGKSNEEGAALFDYTLPTESMQYLDKMRALCAEKGIELILIKAPTNDWKYYWYDEWDEQVVAYAEKYDVKYYNFIDKAEEIGIDWNTDTYDRGVHLNVHGAEKLTSYFGKILVEAHGLESRKSEEELVSLWNEKLRLYENEKNAGLSWKDN